MDSLRGNRIVRRATAHLPRRDAWGAGGFQPGEVLGRTAVNGLRIRIGRVRKLDLCARDAQKTQRIALGESACFFVSNEDVGFLVYGKEGGKVTGFASFNPKTRDHLGNKVGVPLRDALKSETASCWAT